MQQLLLIYCCDVFVVCVFLSASLSAFPLATFLFATLFLAFSALFEATIGTTGSFRTLAFTLTAALLFALTLTSAPLSCSCGVGNKSTGYWTATPGAAPTFLRFPFAFTTRPRTTSRLACIMFAS